MGSLIIIAAMFVLLWVLLIRPQRKRQVEQQQMLSSVAVGDEVLTVGGMYGIVREIDEEDDLIVEIAEGIQVRISRRAVGGVVKPDEDDEEENGDGDDDVPAALEAPVDENEPVTVASEGDDPETANEGVVVNGEESVSEGDARQA